MKLRYFLISLSLVIPPSISVSQPGMSEEPSLSKAAEHIFISNRTNIQVVFYLESANTNKTEHHLAANSGTTISGAPGDTWFNIDVYSQTGHVSYGLNAGDRHYLDWNAAGILDVYKYPPQ